MRSPAPARIIFVTGTDTGVGKTVVTGLLLAHLRARAASVAALKPFCSGGRGDAFLLAELQESLPIDTINPYCYAAPLAPMVAARQENKRVSLREVKSWIRRASRGFEIVLVEGAGGLLVPLCEDGSVLDLMRALRGEALVVAANRLGTINHTLLTLRVLKAAGVNRAKVALVETGKPDDSAQTNAEMLREQIGRMPLVRIPWLGKRLVNARAIRAAAGRLETELRALAR